MNILWYREECRLKLIKLRRHKNPRHVQEGLQEKEILVSL